MVSKPYLPSDGFQEEQHDLFEQSQRKRMETIELQVLPEQEDFVATNTESIVEAPDPLRREERRFPLAFMPTVSLSASSCLVTAPFPEMRTNLL